MAPDKRGKNENKREVIEHPIPSPLHRSFQINRSGNDIIYYNINIQNTSSSLAPVNTVASITDNRAEPILYNASDYLATIVRFSIPSFTIPLSIMPIQQNQTAPVNVNLSSLEVAIGYGGVVHRQPLIFVPNNSSTPPTTIDNILIPYYYIFSYQQLLTYFNTALAAALELAKADLAHPAPAGAIAPYFIFDTVNNHISLIAQTTYYDAFSPLQPNPISIYVNNIALPYFVSMPLGLDNTVVPVPAGIAKYTYYQFRMTNYNNNFYQDPTLAPVYPPKFFSLSTESIVNLSYWNIFNAIVLTSGSAPMSKEFVPAGNLNGNPAQNGTTDNFRPIISDYVPLFEMSHSSQSKLVYNPTIWRIVNMNSNSSIYNFDLSIFWEDNYNNIYPLLLAPGQSCSVKIGFFKKEFYNGAFNK